MVEKRLLRYIKSYKDQGYKRGVLIDHLTKYGWSKKEINEAFDALEFAPKTEPKHSPAEVLIIIISSILAVGLVFYLLVLLARAFL